MLRKNSVIVLVKKIGKSHTKKKEKGKGLRGFRAGFSTFTFFRCDLVAVLRLSSVSNSFALFCFPIEKRERCGICAFSTIGCWITENPKWNLWHNSLEPLRIPKTTTFPSNCNGSSLFTTTPIHLSIS